MSLNIILISYWLMITVQSRGGAGYDARHWPEVVAARNAEVQKLTGQVQAALAREAGLVQQISGAQQAHQVRTCWLPLSRCSFMMAQKGAPGIHSGCTFAAKQLAPISSSLPSSYIE